MRWTDFHNLFTERKHFGGRWTIYTSFSDISRDVAMATNLVKKCKLPTCVSLAFINGMEYLYLSVHINSIIEAFISCENCVKFGPVDKAHLWTSGMTRPKNWRILLNISGYTEPIFATLTPYECTFGANDKSGRYFPIWQGTLPWQPNNVAVMKTNWYYVHSPHVRQVAAQVSRLPARGRHYSTERAIC